MCPECGFVKTAVPVSAARRSGGVGSVFDVLDAMLGSYFGFGAIVMLGLTVVFVVLKALVA
jgi:hypothetical protein